MSRFQATDSKIISRVASSNWEGTLPRAEMNALGSKVCELKRRHRIAYLFLKPRRIQNDVSLAGPVLVRCLNVWKHTSFESLCLQGMKHLRQKDK